MVDIVIVGGCIVDLISYVSRFPRPGETIAGYNFIKGHGGKGANQCVMATKLGASTGMIAKLGEDTFGMEYLQCLNEMGINTDFVTFSKKSQTSTAGISVTSDSQNSIIYVPGAVMDLSSDDVLAAEEMIKNANILLCTYEGPSDALLTALTLAKKYNVKTIVNAAPACDSSYEKLYPFIDIICLNETEAEEETGILIKTHEDSEKIMKALHGKGCSLVIITLGAKGAIYQNKDEKNYTHMPARKVEAVDSTGAGDAFMGSLAYFIASQPDKPFSSHIKKSSEIATLSVLKKGTQTSFPCKEDLPNHFFD